MIVRLILIIVAAIVLCALVGYYNHNKSKLESERFQSTTSPRCTQLPSSGITGADSSAAYASASFDAYPTGNMSLPGGVGVPTSSTKSMMDNAGVSLGGGAGAGSISNADVVPSEPLSNEKYRPIDFPVGKGNTTVKDCFPAARLTADELLPKDAANSTWAQVNPAGQGDVKDQNFLTAGYMLGVDTQGQSLRNPNLQLRSDPPNPQYRVSIWNQTTMEPDINRRPMEIGGC